MIEKRTLKKEISFSGVGLHTGKNVNLSLIPSVSGEIIFCRKDLGNLRLPLDPSKIDAKNSSTLVAEGCVIWTIEHLLASLYIFGIDSLTIELDGEEIPIMDGSASPFVQAILQAGIKLLPLEKKAVRILKPFVIKDKDASIGFMPDSDFRITYSIEYPHPVIQRQELSLTISLENFVQGIAPARTFGFMRDVEILRAQGLALGGSFDNAIVLDEEKVLNASLRYPDEFVRHKILDLIGDISLWGHPLFGHIQARKAGHRLHQKALHFLLDHPLCWAHEEGKVPLFLMDSSLPGLNLQPDE